jgi:hypothetical protein
MLLALGVIIIVVLVVIGSQLGTISRTPGEIRDNQDTHLNALVRLAGDEPMQIAIESMNDAGATLTKEMLEYRYGILVKISSQLRSIASAIGGLKPEEPGE